jgi:hypothetical protein
MKDNQISKIITNLEEEKNKYLMDYLKSKGYRPKPTLQYVNNLQKRLKKKDLILKYYQSIEYEDIKETKNGTVINGKVKMLYFIDSISYPIKGIDYQQMLDNWNGENK